jgi:hypothetical protein
MQLPLQLLDPTAVLPRFHRAGRTRLAEPAIASRFQVSNSVGYSPCSRHQALRVASSIVAVTITACSRAAAVQRGLPAPDPLARASARQRSNVATLIPTSRDTKSIAELSGGNSRATIRSLYACPYRATFRYLRPLRFRSYLGDNFFDTEGEINRVGFKLYERFRPDVPPGAEGWGAKGVLEISRIAGTIS